MNVWWFCLLLGWPTIVAAPAPDETDGFYDPDVLQSIHLEVKAEDLERMQRALPERVYVPATFRWKDQVIEGVGLRYKGNSSSIPEARHKRSFLVRFAKYRKGQRFLGLRNVALDNGIQFGGLFSERLITDVLRGVGVKASRCNYAQVYVNGQAAGVYVNVERIDESFLERHFPPGHGVLFKVDEGGPGADLQYLGDDAESYRRAFELHSGEEATAFAQLVEFIRGLNAPSAGAVDWQQQLDLDAFLKTTAVMLFAGAFDQYTGWGPHNYYLYREPVERRWSYLPWDLDVGFADHAFGRIPVLDGWHAAWPVPVPGRPLMERVVGDPVLLERYREQAKRILEAWFRPEVLIPKLRALHGQIRTALEQDPHVPRRVTVPTDRGYEDVLGSMEAFIGRRYELAREQLASPGNRPVPAPVSPEPDRAGPTPGPPSADAPSDLEVVRVSRTGVELRWKDHAEGEVAFVVQRCMGAAGGDFVNFIGQGGRDITTVVDRDVRPGMTYRYRVYAVRPTPGGARGTGVSNVVTVVVPRDESRADACLGDGRFIDARAVPGSRLLPRRWLCAENPPDCSGGYSGRRWPIEDVDGRSSCRSTGSCCRPNG